ncbi:nitrite reductase small subunit NirD [Candidatus Contendibacter odensensis]|nr:nitrite reductase small subunit NirD [Candidatus Contendobacter odensis]
MYDWHEIGELDNIPRLGSRVVNTPYGDVAIFRAADDQVFALRDRCPHKGGPLSQGIVYGHRVTCPLHNWVLELDSGQAVAPDVGCATCYPLRLENGRIWLGLNNLVNLSAAPQQAA